MVEQATLSTYIEDQYLPTMYGGTAPDPDPGGSAHWAAVVGMQTERDKHASEQAFIDAARLVLSVWLIV